MFIISLHVQQEASDLLFRHIALLCYAMQYHEVIGLERWKCVSVGQSLSGCSSLSLHACSYFLQIKYEHKQ